MEAVVKFAPPMYKAGSLLKWSLRCVNIQHILTAFSSAPGRRCGALPWGFLQLCISPSSMQWAEGPSVQRSISQLFWNSLTSYSFFTPSSAPLYQAKKKKRNAYFRVCTMKERHRERLFQDTSSTTHLSQNCFQLGGFTMFKVVCFLAFLFSILRAPQAGESLEFWITSCGRNPKQIKLKVTTR